VQRQHARPPREPPLRLGLNKLEIVPHDDLTHDHLHDRRSIESSRASAVSTTTSTRSEGSRDSPNHTPGTPHMERVPRVRQLGRLRLAHLSFHRTQHARVHEAEALEIQGTGVMRRALHHGLDGRAGPIPGVQFRPVREGKWLQRMAACRHC
jgi:hypothetical protein